MPAAIFDCTSDSLNPSLSRTADMSTPLEGKEAKKIIAARDEIREYKMTIFFKM